MRIRDLLCGCLLLVVLVGSAGGQEWARFRGPDGTGIGKGEAIPASLTEKDYKWKVKLPAAGHSSPVLWGKKIFLTCSPRSGPKRQVLCIDAADGRTLWAWDDAFDSYRHNRLNSFAASTPAVDADGVYVSWISGSKFVALALDHGGKPLWRREMPDFRARHGAGASPIVVDGVVIVGNTHIGASSFMIGLDAKTGKVRWKHDCTSGPTSYATPGIYRPKGSAAPEVIFISSSHGITSLDPASGRLNWEAGGRFRLKSVASPVVAGGLIFASAGDGGGGRESAAVRPGKSGGSKAEVAYKLGDFVPYVPTPIAVGEHLFVLHDRDKLTCVSPATGKTLWQQRLGGKFYASPVSVNGRIYCIDQKGNITVIEAGPKYKELAKSALPEGIQATPAIANGCMYIRTFNHLICVGKK